MQWGHRVAVGLLVGVALAAAASAASAFTLFESGQVRPLALSPDGSRLFAVNTPDNRLEIFSVSGAGLTHLDSVEVGLEPVAVAARTNTEVWVVNLLSDSVSIVDTSSTPPQVTRTLLVGDEPRDIVFAGPGGNRAFITTARRGQNTTIAPLLTTPGTPRALVFVFDATSLGTTLEGTPLTVLQLFGDTPRALATSPDGSRVYAAVFHSGNQSTAVSEGAVCDDPNLNDDTVAGSCAGGDTTLPGGLPGPERSAAPDPKCGVTGCPRPETGLIVRYDRTAGHWRDQMSRDWDNVVRFELPDYDVFTIDANANPPAQVGPDTAQFAHVGTVLFNMIVNPANDKVYVSNTEAVNEVRFEGPPVVPFATVRSHLHEARITVLDSTPSTGLSTKKLLIKNKLPDDESKNKIVLASKDPNITIPAPGSAGDPRCNMDPSGTVKATLTVSSAASGQSHVANLPCQNWVLLGGILQPKGYKYKDPQLTAGTAKIVVWKTGKLLKAVLQGKGAPVLNYDLQVGIDQGLVDVTFAIPGEHLLMRCDDSGGKNGSNGKLFKGKDCPAPSDSSQVAPRHLNKHIVYSTVPSPAGVKDASLAQPLGMAISSDGTLLYVAAFGSQKVGVFDTSKLEDDTFNPNPQDGEEHIALSGGGPTGVVLDETNNRLYVLTRFDNSISVIDTSNNTEQLGLKQSLYNPEPTSVVDGRPFLYDAFNTSSNGEASCASCHIFGDFDSLAWDLGNPNDNVLDNQNPITLSGFQDPDFHPLKGPMTTQSLRGMANHGPMHWRGDRTGGLDAPSVQPNGGAYSEDLAFKKFNPAFVGLLGRGAQLSAMEMQEFTDFILQVTYPPNPIRPLDNQLVGSALAGRNTYFGVISDSRVCNGCHVLSVPSGFFGTDGQTSFELEPQMFKVPHLRNMYQKVGMFGMPSVPFFTMPGAPLTGLGPQVRGFGFLHDGSVDTLERFHSAVVFTLTPTQRTDLESFMMEFDSNMAPIVGQQVTLTLANAGVMAVTNRLNLMETRAAAVPTECDVVVKGTVLGEQRGWYRQASGNYRSDRAAELLLSSAAMRLQVAVGQDLTYTCVPPGSGVRIGVDRDEDGLFDRDEIDGGSDPADPNDP